MSVVLGTATPGGGFPVYGDAVAATLNEIDPSLDVATRNTKGSTENVPLLETGQLDLALVQGEVAYEALRGKPVAFGARGSGLVILARYVLDGLGLDQTRDFEAIYLDRAGDGPAMVLDGRAAALWGGGIGWPGFTAVTTAGGRLLAPDAEGVRRIQARHGLLKTLTARDLIHPGVLRHLREIGLTSV